eukprot:comp18782_c0_seq1/m.20685 comp18782_c0_seq1/g.20685  ORF comp18782_c0_seq1/g.20685 comp18782_c0_seq1/m.20685 type:complete len:217 (-) comp18782_c0_seq1:132-782(-)
MGKDDGKGGAAAAGPENPEVDMFEALGNLGKCLEGIDPVDRMKIQEEVADLVLVMGKMAKVPAANVIQLAADLLKGGCSEVIFRALTNQVEVMVSGPVNHFQKPETIIYNALRDVKMEKISLNDALIKRLGQHRAKRENISEEEAIEKIKDFVHAQSQLAAAEKQKQQKAKFAESFNKFGGDAGSPKKEEEKKEGPGGTDSPRRERRRREKEGVPA